MKQNGLKQSALQALIACLLLASPLTALAEEGSADNNKTGGQPAQGQPAQGKSAFEFDFYDQIMNPLLTREDERLCGLDKACIDLWRKGKLQIFKEGNLFTADFNMDGKPDTAMILEKYIDDDPTDKAYYIYISTKDAEGKEQILLHEPLVDARNIVDTWYDDKKNALIIDTGGRIQKSESVTQLGGAAFIYESAEKLYKVIIAISWNPKIDKFEIVCPAFGKKKRK